MYVRLGILIISIDNRNDEVRNYAENKEDDGSRKKSTHIEGSR